MEKRPFFLNETVTKVLAFLFNIQSQFRTGIITHGTRICRLY